MFKINYRTSVVIAAIVVWVALPQAASAAVNTSVKAAANVERTAPDQLSVTWEIPGVVDVYVSNRADANLKDALLISVKDNDGRFDYADTNQGRKYFLLRDNKGNIVRVAERLLPLDHGSNFRDIGGYVGAGGKHVRWGVIFRSGGSPMLSDHDMAEVGALNLKHLVDLRSTEERSLAPTKIMGVPYAAVGYSMNTLVTPGTAVRNGSDLYHKFPLLLAPQIRIIFDQLLDRQIPLAYNCSAGQDRTGFATAMILAALGVSREVILADYDLSTKYRHPEFEVPVIDAAVHADNPAALMFAKYQQNPAWRIPTPLKEADGKPFVSGAFEEIEAKWGTVDAYLEKEIGLTPQGKKRLRMLYLE